MAPKKPTVTSSSTRSARVKAGSNPVVTKGEARTRAARTTLGPAPKQRPMATGGTKGPLQGGTRTATAAAPPSGRRTLPAAGQTSGNQANAAKSARVAGMQARRATEAAAGKPSGVRQGQPAGAANRMYGVNRVNAAVTRAVQGGTGNISNLKTGLAGLALGAVSDKYLSPLARKAGTALGKNVVIPAARALDNAMPGINSRDERMRSNSKAAKTGNNSRFAGARDKAMAKAKAIKGSPVLGPKKVGSGGGGGKVGTIAQAFDKSFAAARKAGKSGFTFQGKRYNTKMK